MYGYVSGWCLIDLQGMVWQHVRLAIMCDRLWYMVWLNLQHVIAYHTTGTVSNRVPHGVTS